MEVEGEKAANVACSGKSVREYYVSSGSRIYLDRQLQVQPVCYLGCLRMEAVHSTGLGKQPRS